MDLSIIIPSYNTKNLLDRCLESVLASMKEINLNVEVIVVDNNSTDGSVELLNKKYTRVKKIFKKENLGYGKANNLGIKEAKGEYILLLNSDCILKKNAIERFHHCLTSHSNSFIGAKLYNEDGTPQASCGPFYTLPIIFLMLFLKGDQLQITRYSPDTSKEVDWVSGACLGGERQAFVDVGLFDESIFMYMEEIDLLYRAKQKGYHVWFCPDAHVVHMGAASSKHKKEPVVNIYRGLDYFYQKHTSPLSHAILKLLLRFKAWSVIGICGIMGKKDVKTLYAKALAVLS